MLNKITVVDVIIGVVLLVIAFKVTFTIVKIAIGALICYGLFKIATTEG